MKNIATIEKEIVENFSFSSDWMERYEYLIELGRGLPLLEEKYKTKENLITGCQSQVWLHAEYKDGKVYLQADSDALITKGIVALLIQVLSGQEPKEIIAAELKFIETIGLQEHLSPARRNGLANMIERIKSIAKSYVTKD